ncbi:MAG: DsbA family protein [Actinomycetota bacterium]|nr:DsbA family protein [Actinomycetota bacterium]
MRRQAPRNRPRLLGVIALGLIALIALAVLASLSLDDGKDEPIEIEGAQDVQRLVGGIPQLDDRLGQDDAPVTVEVFSDVQCTDCADYQLEVVDPLIEQEVRDGDVKLVFRHYSMDADRATGVGGFGAISAGLQDHQWQFIELFFRNQDEIGGAEVISQPFLDQIANGILNLNVEQWQRDFNDERIQDELEEDEMQAVARRLPLEPAIVVTGPLQSRELIEKPSLDQIREAIAEVSG